MELIFGYLTSSGKGVDFDDFAWIDVIADDSKLFVSQSEKFVVGDEPDEALLSNSTIREQPAHRLAVHLMCFEEGCAN